MNHQVSVSFAHLATSDLFIDGIYSGGTQGNQGDDPLHPLLGVGNAGGFRTVGRGRASYVALFSTQAEVDWPDRFTNGGESFLYYGDQRQPGKSVEDTPRGGNRLLADVFAGAAADDSYVRARIPPFFLFLKAGSGRDVIFSGLLAPAAEGLAIESRISDGFEYKNYQANFTVLRPGVIDRKWLKDLRNGKSLTSNGPAEWFKWVSLGS